MLEAEIGKRTDQIEGELARVRQMQAALIAQVESLSRTGGDFREVRAFSRHASINIVRFTTIIGMTTAERSRRSWRHSRRMSLGGDFIELGAWEPSGTAQVAYYEHLT